MPQVCVHCPAHECVLLSQDLPDGSDWRWQGSNKRPRQEQSPATPWGNPNIPQAPSRTVYIKNLAFPATLHDVEQFFAPVGKVCTELWLGLAWYMAWSCWPTT